MKPAKFLTRSEYPGGKIALSKYINENLQYPKEALSKKIQGKVFLKYEVNEKGIIHSISIGIIIGNYKMIPHFITNNMTTSI